MEAHHEPPPTTSPRCLKAGALHRSEEVVDILRELNTLLISTRDNESVTLTKEQISRIKKELERLRNIESAYLTSPT
jgi:hypothetical protein